MTHRVLKAVFGGIVVAFALSGCQEAVTDTAQNIVREFTVRSSDFVVSELHGTGIAVIGYAMPELTADVVENGLIHAYIAVPAAPDEWTALPFTAAVRTVVLTVAYSYSRGLFDVAVTANVPAQALRAALPSLDGWLVKVVIDTP